MSAVRWRATACGHPAEAASRTGGTEMPSPWERHLLLRLSDAGWAPLLRRPWDGTAAACLAHWSRHRLPLVVTRQGGGAPGRVGVGLPAPERFGRRRLALDVCPDDVADVARFPLVESLDALPGSGATADWLDLRHRLARAGCAARLYGSRAWQSITGLTYVHAASDLDLLLPVRGPDEADRVCAALDGAAAGAVRIDGELLFGGGDAVAWREWARFRRGGVAAVLVKRLDGATMASDPIRFEGRPC